VELDSLKFTVETTALDDAITKVGTLQLAVKKLGSDTASPSARQAAKEQAQITLDQVKAETALIEARGKQAKAIEKLSEPQEKLTKAAKDTNAVLERQEKIYENMINYGLSKGQASTLAMAQAQDIAADSAQKLIDVMKDTRKYVGGDTFDKSTAGMVAMQNRYETLLVAAKNYAEGSVLNIRQAQDLALDTERLAAKNQLLGITGADATASINAMTSAFKALATQENEQSRANDAHAALIKKNSEIMAAAERERVEAHLNSGQVLFDTAQLRLKQDQQTHTAIMSEMSSYYKNLEAQDAAHEKAMSKQTKAQVDTTGNAAVALFVKDQEKKAKAVEKSVNDQAKAYAKVEEALARLDNRIVQMSGHDPVSKTAANELFNFEKQLKASGVAADTAAKHLESFRAKQKQISDLASSEEIKRMEHLSRALAPQVTDISVGLLTGQNPLTIFLQQGGQIRDQIGLSQVATENLGKVFKDTFTMMGTMVAAMGKALLLWMATPIGMAISAIAAIGLAAYEASKLLFAFEKQNLELVKTLEVFGNAAGMTSDKIREISREAASVEGVSYNKAVSALIELSKTSEVSGEMFLEFGKNAALFERYAGVSVSETAKQYKELGKDPLKAVMKLSEETGFFTAVIVEQVAELERLGKKDEAAALAQKTLSDAQAASTARMKESLTGFSKFMDTVGSAAQSMWDKITGGAAKVSYGDQISKLKSDLKTLEFDKAMSGAGLASVLFSDPAIKKKEQELAKLEALQARDIKLAQDQQKNKEQTKAQGDFEAFVNKVRITPEKKVQDSALALELSNKLILAAEGDVEKIQQIIQRRDKALHDIETGKKGDKKPKEDSTSAFSISLTNELQQYEKQYAIEIKLQDDFIRQEKARLDNALSAKEITQGEFNARDIAASEKGYTDRQKLSDSFYSGIISKNEKNISEMSKQYLQWVSESSGTPKFAEKNAEAVEELRKKIINANNETSVFIEKIQASATGAKETAFTRFSKQLSILKGEIVGINLAYSEYLQSEANITKQKQQQISLEDKLRFASPEQAAYIKASADETERLTKQVQEYDKQIRAAELSLNGALSVAQEQYVATGEVTEQTQKLLDKEQERYNLLVKTKGLIESTSSAKVAVAGQDAQLKYQKDQMKALSDSVSGAIELGLYEGGDAGSKALRKIIEAELRKPITIFIKAVVGDILGGSVAGGSTSLVSSLGSAVSSSSLFSEGGSLAGAGVFASKLGAGIANGFASTMAGASVSSTLGVGSTVGGAAGAGLGIGAVAPYALAALAVYSLMKDNGGTPTATTGDANISFGSKGDITSRKTSSDYFWGGSMTKAADDFVLNLNKTYLDTAKNLGIAAVDTYFSYSGNTGENGSKPNFAIRSSAGNQTYSSGETSLSDTAVSLAASRAVLNALQKSDLPKYLSGVFDGITVSSMTQEQITSSLAGATALKEFHDQLQLLPFQSLKDLSYTATEALKYFSGGLDKFGTNLGTYYDKFYTAEEKNTVLLNNTKKAFEDLGLVLPDINDKTRANYRAMVDELSAKDLSISKNAAAYAGVLQLADSVDKLAPALDKTSTAIVDTVKILQDAANEAIATNNKLLQDRLQSATDQANAAMSALTKSVQAQKDANATLLSTQSDAIQLSLDGVSSSISKLKELSSSLKSTLDGMRITGSEGGYRLSAQEQIRQALLKARSGGGLPLDGQLTSALATVSKPSENLFGSFEDYARDFYRTANDISDLNDLTNKQLTENEVTQGILNKQLKEIKAGFDTENKALDDILKNAQLQLDAANGLDVTIRTVTESLKSFGDAILKLTSERATQDLATSRGVTYTKEDILAAVKASLEAGGSVADIYKAAALKFGVGASTITEATTGSGLVGFNQTPTKYSPEEILSAVKASLSQGATVADIYKAAYDKFGVTTAQVNSAVQGQGLSGFTTGAATGTQFSQDQMAAWLSQANAAGWSVAEMYNRALSDYGVSNSTLAQVGHAVGIPGFAVGTNYVPYDMTANIHKGERIIPAADNLMLMDTLSRVSYNQQGSNDSELKEELNDMKILLKSALDKIADNTKQTADLLDAVTAGGNAMLTEVA